jgi:heterodisulfide reductase subunit B
VLYPAELRAPARSLTLPEQMGNLGRIHSPCTKCTGALPAVLVVTAINSKMRITRNRSRKKLLLGGIRQGFGK